MDYILDVENIKELIDNESKKYDNNLSNIFITWQENEFYYELVLEFCTTNEYKSSSNDLSRFGAIIKIGQYEKIHDLILSGRKLYYELRKEFKTIKRNLSMN